MKLNTEKKKSAITLLNDGIKRKQQGNCNSWPNTTYYLQWGNPEKCTDRD